MTVLEVLDEEDVGGVAGRWVSVPVHMDPDCGCGTAEALLVSLAPVDTPWLPAGWAFEGREALVRSCLGHGEDAWWQGVARLTAAFGLPWEVLTVSMMRGQCVLLAVLEEATKDQVAELEPGVLIGMREANPMPADMVRALRFMRAFEGSVG